MTPDEFRAAREFLRLEIRWLAAHLGVTVRQLNRWENGVTPIPARAVKVLEEFLGEYVPTWGCSNCTRSFDTYSKAKLHTEPRARDCSAGAEVTWPGLPWVPEVEA
jgi:transcriptional regulator with XRE-family HTH domain